MTYSINPVIIAAGSGAQTVTIQVQTPKLAGALHRQGTPSPLVALAMLLPMLGVVQLRRTTSSRARRVALVLGLLLIIVVVGMSACGGGGTLAMSHNYTLQLNASCGTLRHATSLNLTIK